MKPEGEHGSPVARRRQSGAWGRGGGGLGAWFGNWAIGRGALGVLMGVLVLGAGGEARSQEEAAAFFKGNCMACHTIGGGRLAGPDLKNVAQRRDREWLRSFIIDPGAKISAGDPYALELLDKARGVVMPTLPQVTPEIVDALLDLIEKESGLGVSQFKGGAALPTPFTAEDLEEGREIFTGVRPLANGGTNCASCHSAPGLPGLGGGALGPDLSRVADRLGGRPGLSGWLRAPATPTMRAAFQDHPLEPEEIHALAALFDDASSRPEEAEPSGGPLVFLALGLGVAVVILGALELAYRARPRNVPEQMVESVNAEI